VAVLLGLSCAARAEERILSYDSRITVAADATMTVRETIQVVCENDQINHGIYRDFPTKYRDHYGNRYVVEFKVLDVQRDGNEEPYFLERMSNGWRVYVGSSEVLLEPGVYTYELTYATNRQLGFFPDHDELYWNATGNAWAFTIEEATASVQLPGGVPPDGVKVEGYTGKQGSKEQDYTAYVDAQGVSHFAATRALQPTEGRRL